MSDDASHAAAGQPALQTAAPQPAQQTASGDGSGQTGAVNQPAIDPAVMRNAQAYAGARPIIDRLVQNGVKSPEQLDALFGTVSKFNQLNDTLTKNNLTVDTLAAMFSGQPAAPNQAPPTQQSAPIGLDQVRSVVGEELRSHSLRNEHNANYAAEQQAMTAALDGLAGGDEKIKGIAKMLFNAKVSELDRFYPEGHPLAETAYRPLSAAEIKQVSDEVKAALQDLRGTQAVQQAQQALNAPRQPSGGALQTAPGSANNDVPIYQNREALMAYAQQIGQQTQAQLSRYPTPM